ncbi:MAG TPA: ATP-binding protein, partial [Planctomycetota bacterium]|nr:ATP-binding protein [Planctomycetota bacterium]
DEGFLQLVLVHLLSNAIKFVDPGVPAQVVIGVEEAPEHVRIVIQDNGIGIPAEHHERIFGLFEQLALPESYPGTGIGLAIAKKAMERMGGRIDFESVPGKGSRFWVDLPR